MIVIKRINPKTIREAATNLQIYADWTAFYI